MKLEDGQERLLGNFRRLAAVLVCDDVADVRSMEK
jgi:hypothetical protein